MASGLPWSPGMLLPRPIATRQGALLRVTVLPASLLLEVATGDDPHVAEAVRDWGLRLVHGDLRGVCPAEGDDPVSDGGGERFNQVDALLLHHGDGDIRQVHVGDRVSEVIRSRGGGEVRPDDDVHLEVLSLGLLEVVDPVVAKGFQAHKFNAVSHGVLATLLPPPGRRPGGSNKPRPPRPARGPRCAPAPPKSPPGPPARRPPRSRRPPSPGNRGRRRWRGAGR